VRFTLDSDHRTAPQFDDRHDHKLERILY